MKRYLATVCMMLVLAGACFFVPSFLLHWQDETRAASPIVEEVRVMQLAYQAELPLSEKLHLMANAASGTMLLANGKNYTQETVYDKAKEELEKLEALGILDLQEQSCLPSTDAYVELFVDVEDGSRSLMAWVMEWETQQYHLTFLLDDETGKILCISQHDRLAVDMKTFANVAADAGTETDVTSQQEAVAEKWGEYLGLTLTAFALTEEKGYYEAYAAAGYPEAFAGQFAKAEYEDETGTASYLLCFSAGSIIFSAETLI